MEKKEVEARVRKVAAAVLEVDPKIVTTQSNFVLDLGADSRQSVELVAAFEEEFDIEMDEAQALAVQTIGDAVDFIAAIANA
ncbi:MAG: acyl carrier protein [Planctomycetota bacterium]